MANANYIMDNEDETVRLDLKTDVSVLTQQALWAGVKPGMRIADMGCGSGKTTYHLNRLVQPEGSAVGIDSSSQRIRYAQEHHPDTGITYHERDFRESLHDLGRFDFIWARFILEFYRSSAFEIVENFASLLNAGGILFLGDLDHHCMNHSGIPPKLDSAIKGIIMTLQDRTDFDAYAGRRLYGHLYDLGFADIRVSLSAHHLIYGEICGADAYNWKTKLEVAARNSGYGFDEFDDGYEGFKRACSGFFDNPRRFTYTPVICCAGKKI